MQIVLQKVQVSQAQRNWFVSQEAAVHKRRERVDFHTPDMNKDKCVRQKLRTIMV